MDLDYAVDGGGAMIIKQPCVITDRLMAGIKIGGAYLSIGYGGRDRDGRTIYQIWIDLPDGTEHEITDLKSGCQGGTLQSGLESLLSFLGAAAESRQYRDDPDVPGENEDLFVPAVVDWADQNSDEISMAGCELEETAGVITE